MKAKEFDKAFDEGVDISEFLDVVQNVPSIPRRE